MLPGQVWLAVDSKRSKRGKRSGNSSSQRRENENITGFSLKNSTENTDAYQIRLFWEERKNGYGPAKRRT